MTAEQLGNILLTQGLIDASAIDDPEGYDECRTLNHLAAVIPDLKAAFQTEAQANLTNQSRLEIARKACASLSSSQIIVIAIDDEGRFQLVTYGDTHLTCKVAAVLGEAALEAVKKEVEFYEVRG